jgi:hypothetical protein
MSQHVYPQIDTLDHITDCGGFCWCEPEALKLCSECGDEPEALAGCYRCDGSGTELAEEGDEGPFIFVHFKSGDENAEEAFLEDGRDGSIHGAGN